MTRALLLVAVVAAAAQAAGEPPRAAPRSVLTRVERAEVRLGEPFGYEIEIEHAPGEVYALAPDLDLPPFRGAEGECRRAARGEDVRTTCAIRLSLFALGPHEIPALPLRLREGGGEASLEVRGPRVTGVGLIAPEAPVESLALRPLAPPVPLRVRSWRLVGWAAALLAALAAALLVRRALRARARTVAAPPEEAPEARLRRRLAALEARGLGARGAAREHFFELSAIVREWIAAVTGVPALDLTTAELCERLARRGETRVDVAALRRFGERADLVKYAREPAGAGECAEALEWARRLAEGTPTSTSAPSPTDRGRS